MRVVVDHVKYYQEVGYMKRSVEKAKDVRVYSLVVTQLRNIVV